MNGVDIETMLAETYGQDRLTMPRDVAERIAAELKSARAVCEAMMEVYSLKFTDSEGIGVIEYSGHEPPAAKVAYALAAWRETANGRS